jgi:hypothetical protein
MGAPIPRLPEPTTMVPIHETASNLLRARDDSAQPIWKLKVGPLHRAETVATATLAVEPWWTCFM